VPSRSGLLDLFTRVDKSLRAFVSDLSRAFLQDASSTLVRPLWEGICDAEVFLAVVLVLMSSGAQAATLNVVGGQLIGASGVDVGGTQYDVAFGDGSCIFLFSGCDEDSDFAFQSLADGLLGAQALADQVFNSDSILGSFDSDPGLTLGCHGLPVSDYCIIYNPTPPLTGSTLIQTQGSFPLRDSATSTPSAPFQMELTEFSMDHGKGE
jgi:hypothetical protein